MKKIDKNIYRLTKPAVLNHLIIPVVGLVDSVWVSKLGISNMLAGQGYGDQVFNMVYYIFSFLPKVLAPEISTLFTQNKKEEIIELINISIILSLSIGTMLSIIFFNYSDFIVKIFVSDKANIRTYAVEYLNYRIYLSLFFNNTILIGMEDFNNTIAINLQSKIVNIIDQI